MRLTIQGNAVIVASTITHAEMLKANKFCPEALIVKHDGDQLYKVSEDATASASKYGIKFDGVDSNGQCSATLLMARNDNSIEEAKDRYGLALAALAQYEGVIKEQIAATADAVDAVFASLDNEEA